MSWLHICPICGKGTNDHIEATLDYPKLGIKQHRCNPKFLVHRDAAMKQEPPVVNRCQSVGCRLDEGSALLGLSEDDPGSDMRR